MTWGHSLHKRHCLCGINVHVSGDISRSESEKVLQVGALVAAVLACGQLIGTIAAVCFIAGYALKRPNLMTVFIYYNVCSHQEGDNKQY